MRFARLRLCGNQYEITGVQGFIQVGDVLVALTPMGSTFSCDDWDIPEGNRLAKFRVHFNSITGISRLTAFTETGVNWYKGQYDPASDEIYEIDFDEYEPVAGFVGYETNKITALGFYKYRCAERPEDLPDNTPDVTPVVDEDEEEEEEVKDDEEIVDDDEVIDGDDDNVDDETDITDPNGETVPDDVAEDEEEDDDVFDQDQNSNDDNDVGNEDDDNGD